MFANVLSVSTYENAQNGNSIRCASDAEKVGSAERIWARSLLVHTNTQLGRPDVGHTWAAGLFAGHIQTADTVDFGWDMAACLVLSADDQASAADWLELACNAECSNFS